jgi:hypothetical protein
MIELIVVVIPIIPLVLCYSIFPVSIVVKANQSCTTVIVLACPIVGVDWRRSETDNHYQYCHKYCNALSGMSFSHDLPQPSLSKSILLS